MNSLQTCILALLLVAITACGKPADPFAPLVGQCITDTQQAPTSATASQAKSYCDCFYAAVKKNWNFATYSVDMARYDQQLSDDDTVPTCLAAAGL